MLGQNIKEMNTLDCKQIVKECPNGVIVQKFHQRGDQTDANVVLVHCKENKTPLGVVVITDVSKKYLAKSIVIAKQLLSNYPNDIQKYIIVNRNLSIEKVKNLLNSEYKDSLAMNVVECTNKIAEEPIFQKRKIATIGPPNTINDVQKLDQILSDLHFDEIKSEDKIILLQERNTERGIGAGPAHPELNTGSAYDKLKTGLENKFKVIPMGIFLKEFNSANLNCYWKKVQDLEFDEFKTNRQKEYSLINHIATKYQGRICLVGMRSGATDAAYYANMPTVCLELEETREDVARNELRAKAALEFANGTFKIVKMPGNSMQSDTKSRLEQLAGTDGFSVFCDKITEAANEIMEKSRNLEDANDNRLESTIIAPQNQLLDQDHHKVKEEGISPDLKETWGDFYLKSLTNGVDNQYRSLETNTISSKENQHSQRSIE